MMITWLSQGRNDPSIATGYCSDDIDANGEKREHIEVLRGSPQAFELAARGLPFSETYKSGVIAWAPSDKPSKEDVNAVIDDFLEVCFAGLDQTDFAVVAYLHKSEKKTDVHVLVASVHLPTGKHFNCAPPRWESSFYPLRDKWNWKKGWARPDDPRRARDIQPGRRPRITAARIKAGLSVQPDAKQLLGELIRDGVTSGSIKTRQDVISTLSDVGSINRIGDNYISIVPEGMSKPVRLKGVLFESGFDVANLKPVMFAVTESESYYIDEVNPEEEAAANSRLQDVLIRRTKYNQERFKRNARRLRSAKKIGIGMGLETSSIKLQDVRHADALTGASQPAVPISSRESQVPTLLNLGPMPAESILLESSHESNTRNFEAVFDQFIERVRAGFRKLRKASESFASAIRDMGLRSTGFEDSNGEAPKAGGRSGSPRP